MGQQCLPINGKPDAPGGPREELYAEFSLKGGYSLRGCLLGDRQIVGSGLELAGLSNRDERTNRIEMHERRT